MTHDCKMYNVEVVEEGDFLYVKLNHPAMNDFINRWPVEHCPVCGEKSKNSHIAHLTMHPRDKI